MRKILTALILLAPATAHAQNYYPSPAVQADGDPSAPEWHQPAAYVREDQVDEGTQNDAAHRADRAYTAYLNTRPRVGWNQTNTAPSRADAAQYAQNVRQYNESRAEYAREMAAWRSSVGYYR